MAQRFQRCDKCLAIAVGFSPRGTFSEFFSSLLHHKLPSIRKLSPVRPFSRKKFLNKTGGRTVFMYEGKQLAASEAILVEAASQAASETVTATQTSDELLEELVRQHSRLVYRIAYAALRSHHDAEDATQETFLRVLRYSSKLAAVENHKTWIARIAWRVAVDRSHRRGRLRESSLDDPERPLGEMPSTDLPAQEAIGGAQIGALLERLIATLPEKLRAPLVLSAVEEISPPEVAAALGISEAAVRARVFRARRILREKLTKGARHEFGSR